MREDVEGFAPGAAQVSRRRDSLGPLVWGGRQGDGKTYLLYRVTKDPQYLEMGREFLEALLERCRTDAGTTVLEDVVTGKQGDLMPSYYLAESLKYLYLLFAPDETLDLDRIVFTTEAHPLRRMP